VSLFSSVCFPFVKQEVEGLEKRLSSSEMQMKGTVERKMTNIESALDRKSILLNQKRVKSLKPQWLLHGNYLSLF
jgi:hypothetical protein